MDVRKRQPIGIELVKRGIVAEGDIDAALQEQRKNPNKKLGEILNELNVCDSQVLIDAIGEIVGVKGLVLTPDKIKIEVLDYISLEIANKNKAVPFDIENGRIKVCFEDTTNTKNIDAIRLLMLNKGLVIEPYITFGNLLENVLRSLGGTATKDMAKIGRDDNITEMIDSIIKTAMEKRASDIHIEPEKDQIRVRYRIDGELFTATTISDNQTK